MGQLRMDNPETLATLCTQQTGGRQAIKTQHRNFNDEHHGPNKKEPMC